VTGAAAGAAPFVSRGAVGRRFQNRHV